jgi:hypothetical protein
MNTNHNINVLMLGGPVDGQMFAVPARERLIRVPTLKDLAGVTHPSAPLNAREAIYTVHALVDVSRVHYVGQTDMNECAMRTLVGAYRRQVPHMSEGSIAENMVLLLGGDADGHRMLMVDGHTTTRVKRDQYQVMRLTGTDRKTYRVGVLDVMSVDPIALLIEGYRK